MLVLTRKEEESIIIDDQIEIKVVKIAGNQVRIGIEAPEEVEIHRREVYEEIVTENQQASEVKVGNLADLMNEVDKESKKGE